MQQYAVQPVGPATDRAFADHRRCGDVAGAALQKDQFRRHTLGYGAAWGGQQIVERRLQLRDAALPHRDGLDDRNAKLGLEPLGIELEPVALGEVDHVQSDDRRQA